MNFAEKRIAFVDFESYYDRKDGYDLKSISITEYVRDSRFWAHGMAYRFLDDEKTHWLAGQHAIEAWVASVDWKNTVVVAHNCKFDGSILAWRFKVKPFAWMDTQALAKAVLGENISGYSLKQLAEYLGLPAKGEISCEGVLHPTLQQLEDLGSYCKNDVDICKGIYEKLIGQFPQGQLSAMDWTIRAFVEPRLRLSTEILSEGVKNEKIRREKIIAASGIDKSVLASNKQFAELLAGRGFTVPTKTSGRTGKQIPAFAKTDGGLMQLARTAPDLYAARIASKANLLETRGESLLAVARTGLFPFDVGYSGAGQTHRYSGGSGAGGNPQNFTRNSFLREAVGVSPEDAMVVGDFAAIELRILVWLAKELRLITKIVNGEDIYSDFASMKYKRIITKADKLERQFGKCSILGLGYQMGWKRFKDAVKTQTGMDISDEEAKATVKLYRGTYTNIPALWEKCQTLLPFIAAGKIGCLWFAPFIRVEKAALVLPSGLKIKYPNLRYGEFFDQRSKEMTEGWHYTVFVKTYESEEVGLYGGKIVENICQALAGELTKNSIERSEAAGLVCVGQCHDEIMAIAPKGREAWGIGVLRAAMEKSPAWLPGLKLKAEIGAGDNWGAAKC